MNCLRLVLSFCLVPLALSSLPLGAQGAPEVIFQTRFQGANALQGWQDVSPSQARLVPDDQGGQAALIGLPEAAGSGTRTIELPLPVAKMRGARFDFRAVIKAEDVAVPPQVYNGIKFMLVTEGPSGKQYPARDHLWGTFGWTPEHFRAVVPADATRATVVLGLEATTGRAWFRDVSVTFNARPFAGGPVTNGRAYTGHPDIPRLRGAMVSPDVTAADLHVLGGEWHANLIRYQLFWVTSDGRFDGWRDPAAYDAWLEGASDGI